MSEILGTKLVKIKMLIDSIVGTFSNAYKMLFAIAVLKINTPKAICDILNMAKSNLTLLASKLRLQKYIDQDKNGLSCKNITYSVTSLGKTKLNVKLNKIGANSPQDITAQIEQIIAK